jgi:hypothetical protein
MADHDRRIGLASDTLSGDQAQSTDAPTEERLIDHMVRLPTEADFEEVLSPEGNSGDIVGSGVSDSTTVSNASIAGTG